MNHSYFLLLFVAITACIITVSCRREVKADPSRKVLFDDGWTFRFASEPEASIRPVDVPHDWSVEPEAARLAGLDSGPFDPDGDYQKGFMLGGTGIYRNSFTLAADDADKSVVLYFEGVYNRSRVKVNGIEAGSNVYGYQSFRVDVTPMCKPYPEVNTVEVLCENEGKNTRWYSGSGMFRHVWLMKVPEKGIDEWDIFARTVAADKSSATVLVTSDVPTDAKVDIYAPGGRKVASGRLSEEIKVKKPALWSPDSPSVYKAVVSNGDDLVCIKFGIRTISVSRENGFLLNGEPLLLKGGCVHHDHGLLGAASYDMAEDRKIQLLKDNGYNAVRCSHNLPSEHFLEACDSLGVMVLDECFDQWFMAKNDDDYHLFFAEQYLDDLSTMLRRDRNHPSVVMWSIGNEIPGRHTDEGREAAAKMRERIYALDGTRPVTAALCTWDNLPMNWMEDSWKAAESLDVVGYNYIDWAYERDLENHPDRIILGTESYASRAANMWNHVEASPAIIGDFVWTAQDYLGESGIGYAMFNRPGVRTPFFAAYPYFNGWCGDIDLIGQKKPQSYYRDVIWEESAVTIGVRLPAPDGYAPRVSGWGYGPEVNAWEDPAVFFTEHNIPNIVHEAEGETFDRDAALETISSKPMTVRVYSRAGSVRLYLNGRLLGEQAPNDLHVAEFQATYEPGTLTAVNVDNGNETDRFELCTSGKPARLKLVADKKTISPDGRALCYVTAELVDTDGRRVQDFESKVKFSVDNGRLLACGNANPTDMESFRNPEPRLYGGCALAIVSAPEGTHGKIRLTACIAGLPDSDIIINVR